MVECIRFWGQLKSSATGQCIGTPPPHTQAQAYPHLQLHARMSSIYGCYIWRDDGRREQRVYDLRCNAGLERFLHTVRKPRRYLQRSEKRIHEQHAKVLWLALSHRSSLASPVLFLFMPSQYREKRITMLLDAGCDVVSAETATKCFDGFR
jgi:hypothetical protein